MNPTIDIVRGELERLFTLEEMTQMSERLLGLAPSEVGGTTAKGSFALALTERCLDGDRIEALVDVILYSRKEVDPRVRDLGALFGQEELAPDQRFGPFVIRRTIGESARGIVYQALREDPGGVLEYAVKVLRREASRDRRAAHRFLTANRLIATIEHPGLPGRLEAGESDSGRFYVAYQHLDAQPLAARLARTGPVAFEDLRPILMGILEPLAAIHEAELVHGDLKSENILVSSRPGDPGATNVCLVDFGADRLRVRGVAPSGQSGLVDVYGSPKTIAPEVVRGRPADPRSDVYAFGAVVYELVTGKSVFDHESATDAAFAHLTRSPEPPSSRAPSGWVSREVDAFVMSLLQKDPARRPKNAAAVLEVLASMGRASTVVRATGTFPSEKLDALAARLLEAPRDLELSLTLENAALQGADPIRVGDAFGAAAAHVRGTDLEDVETKKALLYRAARIYDSSAGDKARAESVFAAIVNLDPHDEIALVALEDVRKALGKYEELVEMLLAKSQAAAPGAPRGRALAEIGRLYASELEDPDQAVVAFVQALCEEPRNDEYAAEIERLCGARSSAWAEQLESIAETLKTGALAPVDQVALLARAGGWYETKLGRADMALAAYQQVLAVDPTHDGASEGLTGIYRRAQQWPELVGVLLARADVTTNAPRARDLRAEAVEVLEMRLGDHDRARGIAMTVLADDPGHARACDAMVRIASQRGDFVTLARVLQNRADARRGQERAEALVKVAELHEQRLNDLAEATRSFEAVLAIDPANLSALKGLERIARQSGKYRELLEVLLRQIDVAATPRQKISLYERVAALHEAEFLDHEAAAEACCAILAIDGSHDGALTALARHYAAMQRWEQACVVYERHAGSTTEPGRRVELLLARARTLSEQIGSPDRAMRAYEQVLSIQPAHAGALEALAQLRETSGDAQAALSAIEALALKAATPQARAEQWMRAGRLLESRGDKDGAIERFKLACEANPHDPAAAAALRNAYAHRGNWLGVVALVERELHAADGDLARARLWGELAKVYHFKLVDPQSAEAAAKKSVELDGTNADGLMVLGDLAFESGRMGDAAKYYESLVGRSAALGKEDAVRILVRFIEAFGKTQPPSAASLPPAPLPRAALGAGPPSQPTLVSEAGSSPWMGEGALGRARSALATPESAPPPPVTNPRMMAAVEALKDLAPQDVDALARASSALFEFGDPKSAYRMHEELFKKYDGVLQGSERAEALYHLGESARRSGDLDAAIEPLREAIGIDPSNPRPYRALAKVYDERADWKSAVDVRRSRLQLALGNERFELLLEIGDLSFARLDDRERASKAYAEALEERPDDRKLLTKLMQLYSEEKNWGKVCDVVLRLADGVSDPRQRAKYMHTAATIASKHLGDDALSLDYYRRALDFDPTLEKALGEAIELHHAHGQHEQVERLLKTQLDQAKTSQDRDKIVRVLDQLGELYLKFLNEPDLAADAYEAAQAFDPDDRARAEKLAEIFAADPAQYLDKAVAAQSAILRKNPYRVESYKVLRKLYTEAKRADPAWCLCQALAILRIAEPDEERFYLKHRAESAAPAQATLDDAMWRHLAHWDLDPVITRIFATIQPTILRTRSRSLEELGFEEQYAVDTAMHPYPVSQTLYYAQGVLAMPPVLVFQNPSEPGALGIIHAQTPAIALGQAAFDSAISNQSLAFMAGRHLASFRPGFYVRHLVPTGTGLKAWLFAAIKLCVPQFPIAPDLAGQVTEAMGAMARDFGGSEKDKLASAVSKLLQTGGAIDLKKWVAAIDLTADRVGLLLAHDLQIATEGVRSTEDGSSVAVKERMKDIVLFSVSEEYFSIREKLRVSIDA